MALKPTLSSKQFVLASLVGALVALHQPLLANPLVSGPIDRKVIIDLIQTGQADQAIAALSDKLRAEPGNLDLANNLAVLLSGLGQTTQAREVLEQALLANPEAASTFKNLRELASLQFAESYAKALGQKPQPKKVALEAPLSLSPEDIRQAQAVAEERARAKARAEALAKAEAERQAKLAAAEAARLAQLAKADALAAAQPKPPQTKAEPAAVSEAARQLPKRLEAWAAAWASKDFDRYAAFYAQSYRTDEHPSLDQWLRFRKPRIVNKGRIRVEVSNIDVSARNDGGFEVVYSQRYESGSLKVSSRKRQVWVVESGQWRIQAEQSGS